MYSSYHSRSKICENIVWTRSIRLTKPIVCKVSRSTVYIYTAHLIDRVFNDVSDVYCTVGSSSTCYCYGTEKITARHANVTNLDRGRTRACIKIRITLCHNNCHVSPFFLFFPRRSRLTGIILCSVKTNNHKSPRAPQTLYNVHVSNRSNIRAKYQILYCTVSFLTYRSSHHYYNIIMCARRARCKMSTSTRPCAVMSRRVMYVLYIILTLYTPTAS